MFMAKTHKWYLERIVWLVAGCVVLTGTLLGFFVHKYWLFLPMLAGCNMIIFATTGFCPLAIILDKAGVRSITEQCDVKRSQ